MKYRYGYRKTSYSGYYVLMAIGFLALLVTGFGARLPLGS